MLKHVQNLNKKITAGRKKVQTITKLIEETRRAINNGKGIFEDLLIVTGLVHEDEFKDNSHLSEWDQCMLDLE